MRRPPAPLKAAPIYSSSLVPNSSLPPGVLSHLSTYSQGRNKTLKVGGGKGSRLSALGKEEKEDYEEDEREVSSSSSFLLSIYHPLSRNNALGTPERGKEEISWLTSPPPSSSLLLSRLSLSRAISFLPPSFRSRNRNWGTDWVGSTIVQYRARMLPLIISLALSWERDLSYG